MRVDTKMNKSDKTTNNLPVKTFEKDGENVLSRDILHKVLTIELNNDQNPRENVLSHRSVCEHNLAFAHKSGLCLAYVHRPT